MTLEEAIIHCEEVVKTKSEDFEEYCKNDENNYIIEKCAECIEEHKQLAEWLKELKQLREQTKWISVSERLPDKYGWYICSLKDGRVNFLYWDNQRAIWVDNVRKNMFELYTIRSKLTNKEISMEQEAVYWDGWVIAWMPLPEPYKTESEEGESDGK